MLESSRTFTITNGRLFAERIAAETIQFSTLMKSEYGMAQPGLTEEKLTNRFMSYDDLQEILVGMIEIRKRLSEKIAEAL